MAVENDIVLIYLEDSPVFFARVESIWPDVKKDWFNIELLVLQIPLKVVVWTLKDVYINGEAFFMGGKQMKMELVVAPDENLEAVNLEGDEPNMDVPGEEALESDLVHPSPAGEKTTPSKESAPEKKNGQGGEIISFADFQKRKKKD